MDLPALGSNLSQIYSEPYARFSLLPICRISFRIDRGYCDFVHEIRKNSRIQSEKKGGIKRFFDIFQYNPSAEAQIIANVFSTRNFKHCHALHWFFNFKFSVRW